jgi:transposase InsO family protein
VLAVAVDCFTKWVEVRKFPAKTPELISDWFELDIIARYGIPRIVRTDNGTEFEGSFAKLMTTYGITRRQTSPGHPQANG